MMRILVGTPCFGSRVTSRYMTSLLAAREACREHGVDLVDYATGGRALITLLRSQMASAFLANGTFDALLWIDADITFPPDDVLAMVEGIRAGLPIVAAPYALKCIDWERVRLAALAGASAEELRAAGSRCIVAMNEDDISPEGYVGPRKKVGNIEFVRARRVGTGFMGIHRRVFESIVEKSGDELRYRGGPRDSGAPEVQYAFFRTPLENELWPPEDYAFCDLALRHGFEVWLWPGARLTHIGDFEYGGAFDADEHARTLYAMRPSTRGMPALVSRRSPP